MGLGIAVGVVLWSLADGGSEIKFFRALDYWKVIGGDSVIWAVVAWLVGSFCLGKIFGGK